MILVTGITGLTGKFLYNELQLKMPDLDIRYFVRKSSDISWMKNKDNIFFGELSNVEDIRSALDGVNTVLHLAPRNMLHNILLACKDSDVNRFFYVNSTGIYSKFKSSSHIDLKNEDELKNSDLVYTIIRPTMIYGNHQDGNIHLLAKLINKFRIFPVVGKGCGLMHPIYANDVAKVLVSAIAKEEITRFKEYNVAGKSPLQYKEVLHNISRAMGKKTLFIHIPYSFALAVGKIGDRIPNRIITYEKVLRLNEDKNFDYSKAKNDLNFLPISFEEGVKNEIKVLREQRII